MQAGVSAGTGSGRNGKLGVRRHTIKRQIGVGHAVEPRCIAGGGFGQMRRNHADTPVVAGFTGRKRGCG